MMDNRLIAHADSPQKPRIGIFGVNINLSPGMQRLKGIPDRNISDLIQPRVQPGSPASGVIRAQKAAIPGVETMGPGGHLKVARCLPGAEALKRELRSAKVRITSHRSAQFEGSGAHLAYLADFIKPEGTSYEYEAGRFEISRHLEMLEAAGFGNPGCLAIFEPNISDPTAAQNYACLIATR